MVRGRWCQSKNDSADIDNLFQLITSNWVSEFGSEKLEHAVPALSCVMKCQMGVAGQADGWDPGSDMLKGHFTRAQLQADLYNRTATQYT